MNLNAALVDTSLGLLGIAWSARGLTRVALPLVEAPGGAPDARGARGARGAQQDASREAMTRALREATAGASVGAPIGAGAAWAERLRAHLDGEDVAFDDLPLDETGSSDFQRRVHAAARLIPRGTTVTYAALAKAVGTGAARAIGGALGKNPTPIVVPCHRIVAANHAGGFSAPGGLSTKAQLLAIEGGALDDETHAFARAHLARIDPALAPLVRSIACTLPVRPSGNLFRTLVRAIAGQQLSTKAAATIFGRLEAALSVPDARPTGARWPDDAPARVLALADAELRGAGLSAAKAASIRDLSRRVADGTLDLARVARLPDERAIEALTAVRGIGRWTAEMVLVFDLGRPDVLPVDDLGIKKGMQRVHALRALPDAAALTKRAEAWRPFRSIGSWYLWRALES